MNVLRYTQIILCGLLVLLLSGCAAEDGDLTPPDATINGVVSPRIDSSVALSGTVDADALITVDVTLGSGVKEDVIQGSGVWSCVINGMSEGTNTINVTATDPVGNTRFMSNSIVVDLTGPVVTLDQFVTPTPIGAQVLAGTVSDLDAFDVEVSIDGGGSWFSVDDINGGIWTFTANLPVGAISDVRVRGVDNLFNSTDPLEYAEAAIDVDLTADVIDVTEASLGPVYIAAPDVTSTLLLNGTRTADYTVEIASVSPVSSVTVDNSAIDSAAWTADFLALPAGNTVATFGLNDLSVPDPVEVAQAKILVVRDLSGPVLIDNVPEHGTNNVSIADPLLLTFSETMAPIVNDGTFINLVDEAGNIITFSTDPSTADSRTFSFEADLSTPILNATKYTVNFLTSETMIVTDEFANLFIRPIDLWTFTTQ